MAGYQRRTPGEARLGPGSPAERAVGAGDGPWPAEGLRLALFSGNYNYTRDGANQALNRLVGYMQAAGAAVRVYSPTAPRAAFPPTGPLVSVPSVRVPGRGEYRLALGLPPGVRSDLAEFAPTLVHLSAPDLLGRAALGFAKARGIPVVASLHTRFETYLDYYGLGWLTPAAARYLDGFYAACDRVLAPNRPMAELLRAGEAAGRVRLWSRGVDRSRFSPARRDPAWRRAQGFADDEVVVLFFGRLVMEKGVTAFTESVSAAMRANARIRALVVGDGPARAAFEAGLPGAVFTGELSGEALGRAVASADILLNPSRTEAFGNVTLEAMAAGLAVVCPRAPSTLDLVEHEATGLLYDPEDRAAPAAAVSRLAADETARRRLGRAAREASARHDWDACLAAVLAVYREVGGLSSAPLETGRRRRA